MNIETFLMKTSVLTIPAMLLEITTFAVAVQFKNIELNSLLVDIMMYTFYGGISCYVVAVAMAYIKDYIKKNRDENGK